MTFIGVGEWLARREQLTPEKIALIDAESQQRFSYRTLNLRVCALAALFREQFALQKGERVAILARNAPEYLDAFFACALLGAMLVPLNTRLTVHELTGILRDCEPKLLLYDDVHAAPVAEIVAMLNAGRQDPLQARPRTLPYSAFPGASVELARRAVPFQTSDGEEPVLILYTSGTTGSPKGALLSHRMLTWNAVNTQVSWGLRDTDITPTFAPFFHAGGLNVLTTPLYHCGGTVVLLSSFDPTLLLSVLAEERCTLLFAVPTVFQMLLEHPAFASSDLSSIRFCITGGSSCPLPVISAYAQHGLEFRQGYGLTEVGVNCFSLAPEDALRKAGSVGRPVFHSRARVVDEADRDVAGGDVGELLLSGSHVCSGYWRQPRATAEARLGDWWRTGDLVRCDDEGYYYIVGRKKDMLISGGENVYPAEVEGVLAMHPAISEVAVIARSDARWGEVPCAVVALRQPGSVTAEEISAFCSGKLARYKIPRTIIFTDSLPRNAMGKVIKTVLRELYGS